MSDSTPTKIFSGTADLAINGATPAFADPVHVGRPNVADREAFMRRLEAVLDRNWLTNDGPAVRELEARLAEFLGVRHCVAMCNGTIALEIAIRALGLGGEVIVPSYTFVATAHALHWQAITPVFADIDPSTHNLDPASVRKMVTPRTTGIIGVHLWGRPAAIEQLQDVADEFGLKLMFDAAHAFGCTHRGTMIGNFGRCEVLSFHATKAFNTFEGGAVVTNDDALAETMRLMRNFGFSGYDNVVHPGTNGKMVEVCAAMGLANLDGFAAVVASNQRNLDAYREALKDVAHVRLLEYADTERANGHYVVVEISEAFPVSRDELVAALHAEGILARKYFWPGCHRMAPYRDLFPHAGLLLPNTESVSKRVVVLPNGNTLPTSVPQTVAAVMKLLGHR